ncbi:MAG: O-antigen ligase family protein [Patescibacteria group bacterium]
MSKLKTFIRWGQTSRAKYLTSILLLSVSFFNYVYNYSQELFGSRYSQNFLDFTFTIPSLVTILIFLYLIVYSLGFRYISLALIVITTFQLYVTPADLINIYKSYFSTIQLLIIVYFGSQLYHSNLFSSKLKYFIYLAFGLYSIVDYFLLYDSQIVTILYAVGIFFSQVKPNNQRVITIFRGILISFFSINAIAGILQTLFSQSLGLKYLGEPFLNMEITGVAKQQIAEFLILRGYGITSHPNILGFFGICGLILSITPAIRDFWGRWHAYITLISIVLVLISFSRVSWLIAIFLLLAKLMKRFKQLTSLTMVPILLSFFALLYERFGNSDRYRILDITQYLEAISVMSWQQLLFGLGLGRYPEFLFTEFRLPIWQYQPVHNLLLNLTIELGIIPIVLIFLLLSYHYIIKNGRNAQKVRKIGLYTTYFISKNQERQAELDFCLKNNLNNKFIDRIYLWCDHLPEYAQSNPKIVQIKYKDTPTFEHFINHANLHNTDKIAIIANSDIYFDDSLNKLRHFDLDNKFLALTRTENDSKLSPEGSRDWSDSFYSFSQDAWVFEPPLKNFKADFELGKVACDNRLAAEAYFAGLKVFNPCLSINTYHRHASQVRTWSRENSYHGFRAFPAITKLTKTNPKIQITWE